MKNKFDTFVKILDKIISMAPEGKYKKRYSIEDLDALNSSRSRAFLHLFLMSNFGIMDFEEREKFVTDGSQDGGVDAYYFDKENKVKYYIQAKFRISSDNFSSKEIDVKELTSMQISRIESGEINDESGEPYNGKIKGMQDELNGLKNPGQYETKVILLANSSLDQKALRNLTGGYDVVVYDNEKVYSRLVFPVVCGNYFNTEELEISINLSNSEHPRITYKVDLGGQSCNITVLFVPTFEIAKILDKYKNSVLKYNPRSYLTLKNNKVNKSIMSTLVDSSNNEFALFNNGITIVSETCDFAERTGRMNVAKLTLKSPQIINGGQTAFTLSRAYDEHKKDKNRLRELFEGKEVLVKIISFVGDSFDMFDDDLDAIDGGTSFSIEQMDVIDKISSATNRQSPIKEADGKSNDKIQVGFQLYAFNEYGLYYERKRGEFVEGLSNKYIDGDLLVNRDDLVRCCLALDKKPGEARRANQNYLFRDEIVDGFLGNEQRYSMYVVSYLAFKALKKIESQKKSPGYRYAENLYGSALRYGKYAVVCAAMLDCSKADEVDARVECVLAKWDAFENYVRDLEKNFNFFSKDKNMLNYYKSSSVNDDVVSYFS